MIKRINIDYDTIFKEYGESETLLSISTDIMIQWIVYDGINESIHIQSVMFNIKDGYPKEYFVVGHKKQIDDVIYTLYKNKTAKELVELLK